MSGVAARVERPVCSRCGGTEIRVDAAARWDEQLGDWVVRTIFDDGHCDDCEEETELKWVQEPRPHAAASPTLAES